MTSLYLYGTILAVIVGLYIYAKIKSSQNAALKQQLEVEKSNTQAAELVLEDAKRQQAAVTQTIAKLHTKQKVEQQQIDAGARNHFDSEDF